MVTVSVAAASARALEGEPIAHVKFTVEAEAADAESFRGLVSDAVTMK